MQRRQGLVLVAYGSIALQDLVVAAKFRIDFPGGPRFGTGKVTEGITRSLNPKP